MGLMGVNFPGVVLREAAMVIAIIHHHPEKRRSRSDLRIVFSYHLVVIMIIPNFGWVVQLFSFVVD